MNRRLTIDAAGPLTPERLDAFFVYLRAHVAENGAPGAGHFLPMPREASKFSAEREQRFRNRMATPLGEPGWARCAARHALTAGRPRRMLCGTALRAPEARCPHPRPERPTP